MQSNPVTAIGAGCEDIFGDDTETRVYARVFKDNLIFRFAFTSDDACAPTDLINRIVTAYHDKEVENADWTIADMNDVRFAVWSIIAKILPACSGHPEIGGPDVVVLIKPSRHKRAPAEALTPPSVAEDLQNLDVNGEVADPDVVVLTESSRHRQVSAETLTPRSVAENFNINWEVYHDPDYHLYFGILKDTEKELLRHQPRAGQCVGLGSLRREAWLGGRGSTLRVTLSAADDSNPTSYVYKGMDFGVYLYAHDDTDDDPRLLSRLWVNEVKTLQRLPPHPHIPQPPKMFVTTPAPSSSSDGPALCGYLTQYLPDGDLQSRLDTAGNQIPLSTKAKWCYQLISAVAHAHRYGEYHMDIKPSNILLKPNDDIVLIDWEQEDAPAMTLAPEADGSFDVHQLDGILTYTKYTGPPRQNFSSMSNRLWNEWNVFPLWQKECPLALELAEVFSLGRTMWLMFEMPEEEVWEMCEHPDDVQPDWSEKAEAVPQEWKDMVDMCMSRDPNGRPRLSELVAYWYKAWQGDGKELVNSGVLEK